MGNEGNASKRVWGMVIVAILVMGGVTFALSVVSLPLETPPEWLTAWTTYWVSALGAVAVLKKFVEKDGVLDRMFKL